MTFRPILCLDFDGVLHSYASGWVTATFIPDPPVPGAMAFLANAVEKAEVHVYSSRSGQPGGIDAMRTWLHYWATKELELSVGNYVHNQLKWPVEKPPALVTLDDRAVTFTGTFPEVEELLAFQPWNKAPAKAAAEERKQAVFTKAWQAYKEYDDYAPGSQTMTRAEYVGRAVLSVLL